MARPKTFLAEEKIERLAEIGATMIEIAHVLGCSVDTLERRFADTIKKGRAMCKMSLRRKQLEVAMSGNASMLIFLGKAYLGQRDYGLADSEFSTEPPVNGFVFISAEPEEQVALPRS